MKSQAVTQKTEQKLDGQIFQSFSAFCGQPDLRDSMAIGLLIDGTGQPV